MAKRKHSIWRSSASRKPRDRILIVVEGRCTERHYFSDLRKTERLTAVKVEIVTSSKSNPTGIVEYAQSLIENGTDSIEPKSFEYVYVVFDHDDREKDFRQAINRTHQLDKAYKTEYGEKIRFIGIPSVPNFELWFLLHFVKIFPHEMTKTEVLAQLKKHWPEYEKNAEGTYQASKKGLSDALSHADLLRSQTQRSVNDAATDVDVLVRHLLPDAK